MEQLSIKIKIADREYPMKVDPKDEELIRKAGKLLNERIKNYRAKFRIDDKQDLLSMVAFDCLVDNLQQNAGNTTDENDAMLKIQRMNQLVSEAL